VIGEIEAIGPGVQGWKEGQRVGVGFMGSHCGHCENCRRGDFVNCQNQPISGVHGDGGYAEMMIAQATGLAAIPDDLLSTEAAPLLCAGLTTFNGLTKARPGELVAIQGVGGLGHLAVQFAQRMGFQVAVIARGSEKESLAKELGAHHYIDSNAQDPVAALQALGGARLILATAANSKSMSPLLGRLARRPHRLSTRPSFLPTTLSHWPWSKGLQRGGSRFEAPLRRSSPEEWIFGGTRTGPVSLGLCSWRHA
jgi:propanol-preferring alcohol dehydrogenase